ncbi:MAG: hypothetical protein N2999_03510 [Proteobacteria bacterium]|nr:hypothetical protein [Pseudomonadota bacterium]
MRIKKRVVEEGFEGVKRRKVKVLQALKLTKEIKDRITNLRETRYSDLIFFILEISLEKGMSYLSGMRV